MCICVGVCVSDGGIEREWVVAEGGRWRGNVKMGEYQRERERDGERDGQLWGEG